VTNGTRQDHEKFCRIEGWTQVRNARGGTGTHHLTFELPLPSGEILRTRVSYPVNRTTYGASLWNHILRDQLKVTDQQFWSCVKDNVPPERGGTQKAPPKAIPASLVYQLLKAGVPEAEVKQMSRAEALERL
jgi:hypothetical protein